MIKIASLLLLTAFTFGSFQCKSLTSRSANSYREGIKTGADQTEKYVSYLKGKRVALVANQTSIIGDQSSVDSLTSIGVRIVKVFGPEHGFRGNASNGAAVGDDKDAKTGIPIISLYGKNEKPTKAQLEDVDIVVFDIQDVGCRFYTNINTLERVMEACAENNKELMILDRPNPNGYLIDGPILQDKYRSSIGIHKIPMTHAMTIGEFAQMLNGEGYIEGGKNCSLNIIKVANYNHAMSYVLPVNPSPNLNTPQSVLLFPSLCWFEGTAINEGRGTQMPFTILGAPALKGIYEFSYMPVAIPGMSERPQHKDQVCYGLDLRKYDVNQLRKSGQVNLGWLIKLYNAYPDKEKFFPVNAATGIHPFDLRSGSPDLREQIIAGKSEAEIRKSWEAGLSSYKKMRAKYLLYPDK